MHPMKRMVTAALSRDISHGDFRLYVILQGVAISAGAKNEYFPVTLEGLQILHPGTSNPDGVSSVAPTTVIRQIASLRKAGMVATQGAIHRNDPRKPALIKVLDPSDPDLDVSDEELYSDDYELNLAAIINAQ